MDSIVLASNNSEKCKEITKLLGNCINKLYLQSELNISSIEETGSSFIENAILKARHASKYAKLPAIGDDSGLMIDALGGKPGLYSARFAGINATYKQNIEQVLAMLANTTNRTARYYCVIALVSSADDPMPKIFDGVLDGEILIAPISGGGFGYDPIFYLPSKKCAVSELEIEQKNSLSHRGIAINKLKQWLASSIFDYAKAMSDKTVHRCTSCDGVIPIRKNDRLF